MTLDPGDLAALRAHCEWLGLRGLAPGTVEARRRAIERMARLLPCPVLEASRGQLFAWRRELESGPKTISGYVSHARQFYLWAVAAGLADTDPTEGVPVPRTPRRLPRPIGEQDLLAALAGAPFRIRPWLVLAGWAGLRAKEIAYLRRECVLESAPQPAILIAADATKGRSERLVPMSRFVRAELLPVLPARGWMFGRCDGKRGPNQPAVISHLSNRYLHEAGFTATLHQLRHRFGTQAYQAGHDLRAVQELMGHRDPATTAGYADYARESAIAAVEAIPAPGALQLVWEGPAG